MNIDNAKRVLKIEAEAILALIDRLDSHFNNAVDILYKCQGKVVVIGIGKSGLIAAKIASTFSSTGTPAVFMHGGEGLHGDVGMIASPDTALIISNSGETPEIIEILTSIKQLNVPIVSLLGNNHSTISRESNAILDVSVAEEACPLGLAPTASTTAALAMGDSLAVALLQKRQFKIQDFARAHPGGVLGRRLLLKVSDLMHQGKAIPRVQDNTPMKTVILEMTSKKLGCATVDDQNGNLLGIITDGDLRRGIEGSSEFLSLPAKTIMSSSPHTIEKTTLASEALQIMENHSITSLVVTTDNTTIGVLHLHDILKSGIL